MKNKFNYMLFVTIVLVLFIGLLLINFYDTDERKNYLNDISETLVENNEINYSVKEKIKEIVNQNKEIIYIAIWDNKKSQGEKKKINNAIYCYPNNVSIEGVPHRTIGRTEDPFRIVIGSEDKW